MEQKMRFGVVLGNTEKKLGPDYEQLLRVFFSCFQGRKYSKFAVRIMSFSERQMKLFMTSLLQTVQKLEEKIYLLQPLITMSTKVN